MSPWTTMRRGEFLLGFAASGPLDEPRFVDPVELRKPWAVQRRVDVAIEGHRDIAGHSVRLRVGLGPRFPYELPNIFVADPTELPFLPHVDRAGWVCFAQTEGLVLRASEPERIAQEAFNRALHTLEEGLIGRNASDTYDELEAYWREWSSCPAAPAYLDPDGRLRRIVVAFARPRKGLPGSFPYVADDFANVAAFDARIERHAGQKTALLVPLSRSVLDEQIDPGAFANAEWVRDFVRRHLTAADTEQLRAIAKSEKKLWPFVVLSVPRPAGGRSLVGLHYEQVRDGEHPLLGGTTKIRVRHVALERRDPAALLARGGATTELRNKRVLVVGCGAVGGHVAINIASLGVGAIHLVDHDKLSTENVFRHVLGRAGLGASKAVALKRDIEGRYPFISVSADARRIEDLMHAPDFDWERFDLVVVTTGDITLSRRINEELARAETATIFTWLEPLGIGGHALLAHVGENYRGCYDCLFWDVDGQEVLANRADFAAPGQHFARDLAGCASVFTPYGNLDASSTANLAARLALSALTDAEIRPKLVSWRGDPTVFQRNYRLSERWHDSDAHEFVLPHAACPVCKWAA